MVKLKLFIALFLLAAACSKSENDIAAGAEQIKFGLEKTGKITLESEKESFGRFRQEFRISEDGQYLAFHDITQQKIFLFGRDGRFVNAIGSRGSGPEEFQNVFGYNFSEQNTIWAFDENLNQFKHFDLDGDLLSTVSGIYEDGFTQTQPQLFAHNEKLFIPIKETEYTSPDAANNWRSQLIAVYDTNGEFLRTIGEYGEPVRNPMSYSVRPMIDIDFEEETLLAGYSVSHQLTEIDLKDNEQVFFGKAPPNFMIPTERTDAFEGTEEILRKGLERSFTHGVFYTERYIIYLFQNLSQEWYDTRDPNTKVNYLVFYDREAQAYLGELQTPYAVGAITLDGSLFLIEDIDPEKFTIGLYEIQTTYL